MPIQLKSGEFRGLYPSEVNEDLFYHVGYAFAKVVEKYKVVTARDQRISSSTCQTALNHGLLDGGADVISLGLAPTESIYYASTKGCAGLSITASHNPDDYNGLKSILPYGEVLSQGPDLDQINQILKENLNETPTKVGRLESDKTFFREQIEYYLTKISNLNTPPIKILAYALGGCGEILSRPIFQILGIQVDWLDTKIEAEATPNPLDPIHLKHIKNVMQEKDYDFGISWDGDADRCLFFDKTGEPIPSIYITGLIAETILEQNPGQKIVIDPKLIWNLQDIVSTNGGELIITKTGHLNLKKMMREQNAFYGGEQSGHHYFKDFSFCDSGVLPWVHVLNAISLRSKSLNEMISERQQKYPLLPEISLPIHDTRHAMTKLNHRFENLADSIDHLDGVSYQFDNEGWRFNFRPSKTEPVARLNIEGKDNLEMLVEKRNQLLQILA